MQGAHSTKYVVRVAGNYRLTASVLEPDDVHLYRNRVRLTEASPRIEWVGQLAEGDLIEAHGDVDVPVLNAILLE